MWWEDESVPMNKVPYMNGIPEPTSAPMITAFGVTLLAAGMVTNGWVAAGGAVILVVGLVIWFSDVFPHERIDPIPEEANAAPALDFAVAAPKAHAARPVYPEVVYPYRSGVVGGLIGGVAMGIVAMGWGLTGGGGIWLPINLLSAAVMPSIGSADEATLRLFNAEWFAVALGIHLVLSVSSGVLYTIALPIMFRWPILAGGILVPIILSGLVWASLSIVNPTLDRHISWPWFVASQIAFGIACGWWVSGRTPVSARAGGSLADRFQIDRGGKR